MNVSGRIQQFIDHRVPFQIFPVVPETFAICGDHSKIGNVVKNSW
jgi:hypothetical protein